MRPARLLSAALAALLALSLLPLAAAPAVAATDDGDLTWGVRPSSATQGAQRDNYAYTLDPGGQVTDAIVVTNHDEAAPLELDIYAADGYTTGSGQLDLLPRDEASSGLGTWVQLSSTHLSIAPRASVDVPFTLTVPADATPGDHVGGIVTSVSTTGDSGVSVDRRLGIRIAARVAGDLAPALAIENPALTYDASANPFGAGSATVRYTVRNTGNVALTGEQYVSVAGPLGWFRAAPEKIDPLPVLLPGESREVTVAVPGVVPAFALDATVRIEPVYGDVDETGPAIPVAEAGASTPAVPWAAVVAIVLLALIVLVAVIAGRRGRRRRRAREDARVAAAVEAALREQQTLAAR